MMTGDDHSERMADPRSVTEAEFARRVEALPDDDLADFVADLWEESGWEVERGDGRLTVARGGERRVIAIRAGANAEAVDAVVAPGGRPTAGEGVEVIDAADLYRRARYALDDEARAAVFSSHLGEPGWTGRAIEAIQTVTAAVRSEANVGRRAWLAVAAATAAVLVAAAVAGTGSLAGDVGGLDGGTPTGTPAPTPTDGTQRGAGGATADDTVATATTPVPTPGSTQPRYRDLTPTCDRPPGLVVAAFVGALRNDGGTGEGVRTAWDLSIHQAGASYASFENFIRSEEFAPLFTYRRATYGQVETGSGVVVQRVTVTDAGGREASYEFYLSKGHRLPECWRVASVLRADG